MSVIDVVMIKMKYSNVPSFSGIVILDKYYTRIPRKEKKKIKKQFGI